MAGKVGACHAVAPRHPLCRGRRTKGWSEPAGHGRRAGVSPWASPAHQEGMRATPARPGPGGRARAGEGGAAGCRPPPPGPSPPQKRLKGALVLVQRAAQRGAAQLAELLRRAAVLGLLLATARVHLLYELHQRLGQVHLRGLFQLHRDERRHGKRLNRLSGPTDGFTAEGPTRAADRAGGRADQRADGRARRRFGSGHFREALRRRTCRAARGHVMQSGRWLLSPGSR